MSHKACTIFSLQDLRPAVLELLRSRLGKKNVEVEGPESAWTKLRFTKRRMLRKTTIELSALPYDGPSGQLSDMLRKMQHVFMSIPAEKPHIQKKLVLMIEMFRFSVGITSNHGLATMEDYVFDIAKALNGFVFWEGNQLLSAKGELILNFKGSSRVQELHVDIPEIETADLSAIPEDARARKTRSEALLKDLDIPFYPNLPPIDSETVAELRSQNEVADRALALLLVALKGEGLEQPVVEKILTDFEIEPALSPQELAFVRDRDPSVEDRTQFTWRYESLWVLLWALGYVEELSYPDKICDVATAVKTIQKAGDRSTFRAQSRMRTLPEILDAADLAYRLHWACVDARLRQESPPADLESGVIYERHYALNWLIRYLDQEWDEVRTDT